jgi:SAM-dependent methyltransferase
MAEDFQPRKNVAPTGFINRLSFLIRLLLDFQALTVYKSIRKFSREFSGSLLDIGCGSSPYRHLFSKDSIKYFGLDTVDAADFKYHNKEITLYDGRTIPFDAETFDGFICTEVMEHVLDYNNFASEIYRVLKKGGSGIITVPWSARFHYAPYDYFRFTPSSLKHIFSNFSDISIIPRGTDITVIAAKIIVVYVRNVISKRYLRTLLMSPLLICFAPLVLLAVLIGHISVLANLGSSDDPLGYTVILTK